ncbi:MAG: ribosomal protection-like ABC-F family protein [Spirochaetales bacterium]
MRISLNNVSHDFAGTVILERVQTEIVAGDKIGLIGPNGAGKTTLLRIITGELTPISGTVTTEPGTTVGYVPQSLVAEASGRVGPFLMADVLELREQLRALEERMAEPSLSADELDRTLVAYQEVRERYDEQQGDLAEEQAKRILSEIGLPVSLEAQIQTLSGGEQNVLAMARAALSRPDLLILDEPGNHLDFAGLAWLERYLADYRGAVLVVSHNRYLLDGVASSIWELSGGRITEYSGGYSDYRFTRISQALSDQATYKAQQKSLARLEALVKTFEQRARAHPDPKNGKRLHARRTQLAKAREASMDKPTLAEERIDLEFAKTDVRSDVAVAIAGYKRAFGANVLFEDASATIYVGERVGIVGPNGSGKSTLLDELTHTGSWENERLRIGPSMRVGYCAQKRGSLDDAPSVFDAVLRFGSFTRREVHSVLGPLLFAWEDIDRPVAELSGGEWNRIQLALAILTRANLLILDEPTNHLDIPSREAVQEALEAFDGTIITVSHDRYFLDAVVSRIIYLEDHMLREFEGSFTEFWSEHGRRFESAGDLSERGRALGRAGGATHRGGGGRSIEQQILELEAEQRTIEQSMEAAFASSDYRRGRKLGENLRLVRARIEELYAAWG